MSGAPVPVSQALATVLVDELVRGGVREAVLCPGSRNAPLSYALAEADAARRLRLHVRIDERTAGFLALGLALGSGAPVMVTCTSGTAAANLHPAMVEADLVGVPVLAVTADRPVHLRQTGANQTIDQVGLFGTAPRWAVDLPAPGAPGTGVGSPVSAGAADNAAWRSLVCRCLNAARGGRSGDPGPVHLNVGFTEPLVPAVGSSAMPENLLGRPDGASWTSSEPAARTRPLLAGPPAGESRTLVVLGAGADPDVAAVAAVRGYPVVVEPPAWAVAEGAVLSAGMLLLGCPELVAAAAPERVIVAGRPTLGRALGSLLTRSGVEVVVCSAAGDWVDPQHVAHRVVTEVSEVPLPAVDRGWRDRWERADSAAADVRDQLTSRGVQGPALARLVRDAAAAGSGRDAATGGRGRDAAGSKPGLLICASSQAIRDLDTVGPVGALDVVANRGAAGIDGTLSTALGAALARGVSRPGSPAYALVGDLAFLHDLTGLVIGPSESRPELVVVVADDGGGAIFATLEYGAPEFADSFERVFGTPHGADIPALCAGLGIVCTSTDDPEQLRAALTTGVGMRVVHVRTDRTGRRTRDAELRGAVRRAVAAALTP